MAHNAMFEVFRAAVAASPEAGRKFVDGLDAGISQYMADTEDNEMRGEVEAVVDALVDFKADLEEVVVASERGVS